MAWGGIHEVCPQRFCDFDTLALVRNLLYQALYPFLPLPYPLGMDVPYGVPLMVCGHTDARGNELVLAWFTNGLTEVLLVSLGRVLTQVRQVH